MYLTFEQAISQQNVAKMHQLFAAGWQCSKDGYWMAPDDGTPLTLEMPCKPVASPAPIK